MSDANETMNAMLNRMLSEGLASHLRAARGLLSSKPRISRKYYRVDFLRSMIDSSVYLIPKYGKHRIASREILSGRFHEPDTHALIGRLLEHRNGDILHAGAFFGDMLPSFSRKCSGIVYAFEPVLENYLLAKLCIQENSLSNVLIWNSGLGEQLAACFMDTGSPTDRHRGGASRVASAGQRTMLMPVDLLQLQNLSVMQLDVEGHEMSALKGARATISKCRPYILIEDNKNNCADFLLSLQYIFVGQIPGIKFWAPESRVAEATQVFEAVLVQEN